MKRVARRAVCYVSPSAFIAATFPARQYSVNGERRSFALLRPVADTAAQEAVRDLILAAYAEHEAAA